MAESVAPATDPLNLMRVMPPKGARVRCRTGGFAAFAAGEPIPSSGDDVDLGKNLSAINNQLLPIR